MTRILLRTEETEFAAFLDDNAAAREYVTLLPITLTMEDYADAEKASDLPKRLSTEGAPKGYDPSVGDITYYDSWGYLAIFYRDFGYARGLVRLGQLDGDATAIERPSSFAMTIKRAD